MSPPPHSTISWRNTASEERSWKRRLLDSALLGQKKSRCGSESKRRPRKSSRSNGSARTTSTTTKGRSSERRRRTNTKRKLASKRKGIGRNKRRWKKVG